MAENKGLKYTIEIDAEKATATIKTLKGEVVNSDIALNDLESEVSKLGSSLSVTEKGINDQVKAMQKLRSEAVIGSKKYQSYTNGINTLQKQLSGASKSSGAMTSSAMELGRVISDAPYGIRGMGNNLSQLASNLFFATKQTGSFTKTISGLMTSLTGPVGILIAIQTVIAVFEGLSNAQRKTEESTDDVTDALGRQKKELRETTKDWIKYKGIQESVTQTNSKEIENLKALVAETVNQENSDNRRVRTLNKLIELYPKYFKAASIEDINDILKSETEVSRVLSNKIKLQEALNRVEIASNEIQLELVKIREDESKRTVSVQERSRRLDGLYEEQKRARELVEVYVGLDTELKEDKSSGSKKSSRIKNLELEFLDLQKLRDSYNKKTVESIDELEKIELASLRKRRDDFVANEGDKTQKYIDALRERLKVETDTVKKNEINTKIAEANIKLNDVKVKAYREYQETLTELAFFYEKKRSEEELKEHNRKLKELGDIQKDNEKLSGQFGKGKTSSTSIPLLKEGVEVARKLKQEADQGLEFAIKTYGVASIQAEEARNTQLKSALELQEREKGLKEAQLERLASYQAAFNEVFSGITDFISGEYDRQMTIEENHTNRLNNELRDRLRNENLSKGERKKIQGEIARNDETLRKKQEKIERERFETNKMAGIASATVNTYLAASQVLADPSTNAWVKIPMAIATISAGLLQVATIARQKFQSSAGAQTPVSASGGGAGGGDREFNFNLAGASNDNAIANAIGSTLDRPIKTYVVADEVTTQQELDLNIKNASIVGG